MQTAVHNHLRRVGCRQVETIRVIVLPLGETGAENRSFHPWPFQYSTCSPSRISSTLVAASLFAELSEQCIGRRAIGAAFGSEQLYYDDLLS